MKTKCRPWRTRVFRSHSILLDLFLYKVKQNQSYNDRKGHKSWICKEALTSRAYHWPKTKQRYRLGSGPSTYFYLPLNNAPLTRPINYMILQIIPNTRVKKQPYLQHGHLLKWPNQHRFRYFHSYKTNLPLLTKWIYQQKGKYACIRKLADIQSYNVLSMPPAQSLLQGVVNKNIDTKYKETRLSAAMNLIYGTEYQKSILLPIVIDCCLSKPKQRQKQQGHRQKLFEFRVAGVWR